MFSDFTWKKKFWSRKWWGAIASCSNYLLQAFENRGYIKQRIVRRNELYFIIKEV